MGHCKDCKHWLKNMPPESRAKRERGFPNHELVDLAQKSGSICILITNNDDDTATNVINGDYADSAAYLYAMPDFGCVLFERKPPEPKPKQRNRYSYDDKIAIFLRHQDGESLESIAASLGMKHKSSVNVIIRSGRRYYEYFQAREQSKAKP